MPLWTSTTQTNWDDGTASASTAWPQWVSAQGTSATATTGMVWNAWQSGLASSTQVTTSSATCQSDIWYYWAFPSALSQTPPVETRRESDADRTARIERQRLAQEQAARKIKAERERAIQLLREVLSEDEMALFVKEKKLSVTAPSGKKYEITLGRSGNVVSIKDGKPIERFCIHPSDACPDEDTILAQKLLIENDEKAFLRIANKTRIAA